MSVDPDALNVGIDGIVVTAEPMPEPGSVQLVGLSVLGLRRRLR